MWDFGVVARGARVSHEFTLRNEGNEALQLREVRPDCGCTVASFDAAVPPGGEGKVRVELDTGGFSGAIAKELQVFTSDAANPVILLTLRAQVLSSLEAQPGYFHFRHTVGAPATASTQVVWSPDFDDLRVLGVTSPSPSVSVAFREAMDAERDPRGRGRQWMVVATLASTPPPGPITGDVRIETNHPRKKVLAVPIAGYVKPLLMVTPPTADFGSFPAGQPRKWSVVVTNNGAAPLELLGVDSDVRGLTARISEREKGKRFDIALSLAPDVPKGPVAGLLRVRTSSPQQPLLEVPVKGEVK